MSNDRLEKARVIEGEKEREKRCSLKCVKFSVIIEEMERGKKKVVDCRA